MRLIFMGTPDFAVPTLIEIVGGGHEVVVVYTRAPRRSEEHTSGLPSHRYLRSFPTRRSSDLVRLIFMGTPDFAVPTLIEIVGRGHEVVAVYTRAPKPGGRSGLDFPEKPVSLTAHGFSIPVLTPKTLRTDEAVAEFRARNADAAVVVAYG